MGAVVIHGYCRRGQKRPRLYGIWIGMRRRCNSPKCKDYCRYGDRGILVCEEWNSSFQNFYDWAITNGYSDNLTIERKDVNKGYSPNNCTWIIAGQQAYNRRTNHKIALNGKKMTISEWAKEYGLQKTTLRARLMAGWNIEEAVKLPSQYSSPTARGNHPVTFGGETHTLTEWSKITGVPPYTISGRLKRGWNIKAALFQTPTNKYKSKKQMLK